MNRHYCCRVYIPEVDTCSVNDVLRLMADAAVYHKRRSGSPVWFYNDFLAWLEDGRFPIYVLTYVLKSPTTTAGADLLLHPTLIETGQVVPLHQYRHNSSRLDDS